MLYQEFARIGKCLSSPKRLEILDLLSQSPKSVEKLAKSTGMSVANVSQHLQTLHNARLVDYKKDGNFVIYELADPAVSDFMDNLHDLSEKQSVQVQQIKKEFLNDNFEMEGLSLPELKDRMENGIDVDVKTVLEMKDLSNFVGVDFEKYFGKLDIEDNMIASVFERKNSFSKKRIDVEPEKYFNAGVILFNLNKIPFSYFSEMRKGMKKNYKFLDQDILNIAFSKDNTFISEKWNFHRYYGKKMFYLKKNLDNLDIRILHYNGSIKPWNKEDFIYLREIYSNYYLKVFGRTLIFKEITRFERIKNNIRKIVDYIKFKFLEV